MAESDETARAEVARFEQYWPAHVRFGSKADILQRLVDVRFTLESGHSSTRSRMSALGHKQTHALQQIIGGLG